MTPANPGNQYLRRLLVIGTMAVGRNLQKTPGRMVDVEPNGGQA